MKQILTIIAVLFSVISCKKDPSLTLTNDTRTAQKTSGYEPEKNGYGTSNNDKGKYGQSSVKDDGFSFGNTNNNSNNLGKCSPIFGGNNTFKDTGAIKLSDSDYGVLGPKDRGKCGKLYK